mmetsp:Transcript_52956/g.94470  ORF Transcript_52956/g.94470 Transcript_52956/m.94470 type:complete len:228 (-) Transcript_52956:1060-1743(-)
MTSRKTGQCSYSPRPIPEYCAPWPGSRSTMGRGGGAGPMCGAGSGKGAASTAAASARVRHTMARRTAKCVRPLSSVACACVSVGASGLARAAARRRACAARAGGVFAEHAKRHQSPVWAGSSASNSGLGPGSGWCSSHTMWTLVPPIPRDVAAAALGMPGLRPPHGSGAVGTLKGEPARGNLGLGAVKWRRPGRVLCCRHSTAFRNPHTPAAVLACPMLALTLPMAQ